MLTWILKGRKLVASRSLDDDRGLLMAGFGYVAVVMGVVVESGLRRRYRARGPHEPTSRI